MLLVDLYPMYESESSSLPSQNRSTCILTGPITRHEKKPSDFSTQYYSDLVS